MVLTYYIDDPFTDIWGDEITVPSELIDVIENFMFARRDKMRCYVSII
jgi:hypothetical protein